MKQETYPAANGWQVDPGTEPVPCKKLEAKMAASGATEAPSWWKDVGNNQAIFVEVMSRALFPLMFFIFNLVYWPMYLS